jgi:hypothetical protein
MIKMPNIKEFKTLAVTIAVAAVFLFGSSVDLLRAQTAPSYTSPSAPAPAPGASAAEVSGVCTVEMQKFSDVEIGKFRDFITTNFQNKSSTGSLLEIAVGRYRELRTALYNKYSTFYPHQGALLLTEGLQPGACLKIVEDTLTQARRELQMRAVQTSTVKKTTALIEKYQQINDKLGNLTRTFLSMKAYLDTFASKLPCYINKACNKG